MSNQQLQNVPDLQHVRTFQGIEEYILKNGLKVLLFEDISQANVTVNLTYLVGSRHEGRGEAGMAHLLEHMLFRGTHKTRDIKGALQDKGANFNATTWYDRTNYYETLTPSDENLEFALALEADRMINSLILPEDLASEMTVVRNEFEMGENNPIHVLHDQLMSAAFRWHNYGKTTIGNRSDIERVPAKSLRKFYEEYYQPDNAVLVIAGQFNKALALELINRYFGDIPKPTRELGKTYTEEPAQDGPREVMLERVGDLPSVGVGYHIPAASHHDHAALRIFIDIITDEPGGLLYKELVETGLCSELFGMTYALFEPGMALCFLRPTSNDKIFDVRDKLLGLIEQRAADNIDAQAVSRLKARILKRYKLALSNSKDVALKLSEAIACGDWRLFFWQRQQIEELDLSDVLRVAKRYFVRSNRTSGVFLPQKTASRVSIAHVPDIEDIVEETKEDASLRAGEAFVATAKNIEALAERKELSQNTKIAMLYKKTRGEAVQAKMLFRYANEQALKPYREELAMLPALLWRGTKKYDYQQLRDRLDALMSSLELGGQAGRLSVAVKSERVYFPQMVELVSQIIADPTFKPEEFAIVRQREIDDFEEVKSDPQRLAFQELERLKSPWPKDSFHYVPSFEERIASLKELSLESVKSAYESTVSSQNLCFAIVGDADFPELLPNVLTLFAQKQSNIPFERIKKPFIMNKAEELRLNTPDKEMAMIAMAFNFAMRDDNPSYAALKLASYIFGETMNSRLMQRIREKEGISYGAGSWLELSRYEENASFNMYAMAAPGSVARAHLAMEEEWQRFLSNGPMEDELKNAAESIWMSFHNSMASDNYIVGALAGDLEIGRTFRWREELFKKMKQLSCREIKSAMKEWWDNAKFSVVIAQDQSKLS